MLLLTPALTRAHSLLEAITAHAEGEACAGLIGAENRSCQLVLHDAAATARDITDLSHAVRQVATQLDGDLAALHRLLTTHSRCASCRDLAHRVASLHYELEGLT